MKAILFMVIGVSVAINILIIKVKLERGRWSDAGMDSTVLVLLTIVFGGSFSGLITATVASSVVSMYLWFYPPKLQLGSFKKKNKSKTTTKRGNNAADDFKNSFQMIVEDFKRGS